MTGSNKTNARIEKLKKHKTPNRTKSLLSVELLDIVGIALFFSLSLGVSGGVCHAQYLTVYGSDLVSLLDSPVLRTFFCRLSRFPEHDGDKHCEEIYNHWQQAQHRELPEYEIIRAN